MFSFIEFHLAYLYNFVEPSSFIRKRFLQHVCDGRVTRHDYRAPHGEWHKGVGGRWFVEPKKSSAGIPKGCNVFHAFTVGECEIADTLSYACPRGDALSFWLAKVPRLQLQTKGAAKKMQRDSKLALAQVAHSLASKYHCGEKKVTTHASP